MALLPRLASKARDVAASRWAGALLTFSGFQWAFGSVALSLGAVAALPLLIVTIPRTRWGSPTASRGDDEQVLEWLAAMLFWTVVWAIHGFDHEPERVVWAIVAAAIYAVYALAAFFDWRARVSTERPASQGAGTPEE
jgi:hypothetical protein